MCNYMKETRRNFIKKGSALAAMTVSVPVLLSEFIIVKSGLVNINGNKSHL